MTGLIVALGGLGRGGEWRIYAIDAVALLGGIALVGYGHRLPDRGLDAVLAFGTLGTTLAVSLTAKVAIEHWNVLYIPCAGLAAYFLPRRRAVLQVALVLVAYSGMRLLNHTGGWGVDMIPTLLIVAGISGVVLAVREATELSEDRFERGFEQSTTGMAVVDLQGRFMRANGAFARMLGREPAELVGRAAVELTHPADREASRRARAAALAGDEAGATIEQRYLRSDGDSVWVRSVNSLFAGRDGRPQMIVNQVEDVTDRRASDERLRRLATLVESSQDSVMIKDADGVIRYWNPAAERLYGYTAEEAVGRHIGMILPAGRVGGEQSQRAAVLAGERVPVVETTRQAKDGRTVEVAITFSSIPGGDGPRPQVAAISRDLSERRRAEWEITRTESIRDRMVESALDCIITIDVMGRIAEFNPAAEALFGYARKEAVGAAVTDLIIPEHDREASRRGFAEFAATGRSPMLGTRTEMEAMRAAGDTFPVELTITRTGEGRDGQPMFTAYIRDLTEARQAHAQQAAVARLGQLALDGWSLESLMEGALEMVESTLATRLALVHKAVPHEDAFVVAAARGWGDEGPARRRFPGGEGTMAGSALLTSSPVVVEDWTTELRFGLSPVAERFALRSSAAVVIEGCDSGFGVLAAGWQAARAVTTDEIDFLQAIANVLATALERERSEEERRHDALHDSITGLPNRTLLVDRLEFVLERGSSAAVLRLDVDKFKLVNDSHGHPAGDELLAAMAPRLRSAVSAGDTVARLGGDEFAVLIHDAESVEEAVRTAERIAAAFTKPLIAAGTEHFITASIGLAVASDGVRADQLMRNADSAMYRAKELGGARYEIHDERVRARTLDRLRIEGDLRHAIERDELSLVFQPIVSLPDGGMTGVEALVRWDHPVRGAVPAGEFIPVAESSGLIEEIGDWVLEQSLAQARTWHAANADRRPLEMSVNLSARELAVTGAVSRIRNTIARSGVDPSAVSLEITESALIDGVENPDEVLRDLKSVGVNLWLDDFGTGYSSLGYLSRFTLDALKVDRSFIEKLGSSPGAGAIVRAIVAMSGSLGLDVVAEGVETTAQLDLLTGLGCSKVQGYLLGRPMPAAAITDLLARNLPLTEAVRA